ncbi:MAG TPA: hypothetical protein VKD46_03465 [bacterium]|nr:hypothetical protein [bacterium]
MAAGVTFIAPASKLSIGAEVLAACDFDAAVEGGYVAQRDAENAGIGWALPGAGGPLGADGTHERRAFRPRATTRVRLVLRRWWRRRQHQSQKLERAREDLAAVH